jgi:hypothetical protein
MQGFRAFACASISLVVICTAATVWAAPPSEGSGVVPELSGVVVDEASKPVAHAKVTARGYQLDQSTESGTDGRFALKITAKLVVCGLIRATDQTGRQGFVESSIGEKSDPVRIVLKQPREIAITVIDKSGNAIQGATVGAAAQNAVLVRQETNAQGKALLRLPEGLRFVNIFAMKADAGFDYVVDSGATEAESRQKRPRTRQRKQEPNARLDRGTDGGCSRDGSNRQAPRRHPVVSLVFQAAQERAVQYDGHVRRRPVRQNDRSARRCHVSIHPVGQPREGRLLDGAGR